jgi:hypothetical protein
MNEVKKTFSAPLSGIHSKKLECIIVHEFADLPAM